MTIQQFFEVLGLRDSMVMIVLIFTKQVLNGGFNVIEPCIELRMLTELL